MKLAVIGVATAIGGLASGIDGLVYVGAVWIVGGVLLRLIVGSPKDLPQLDGGATFAEAYGGKRGVAVFGSIAIGAASVVIGLVPVGFEGDDPWRWLPVALGALIGGIHVLALLMFSAGSGLQELTGHVGDPDHPAVVTVDAVAETGVRINDAPRLALDLTVEPDGRATYQVQIKQVVGFAELGSVRPGERYRALVDLDRPDGVTLQWHEPVGSGGGASDGTADDIAARLSRLEELARDGMITQDEYDAARRDILGHL